MRKKRGSKLKKALAMLLLLVVAAVASAQSLTAGGIQSSWVFGNWLPVAALAVLVAYLIVALAYMIGIGFQYRELVAWANSEFWEATLNAMIVGLCVALVLIFSDITLILTGSSGHIDEGWSYLTRVGNDLNSDWDGLVMLSVGTVAASSFWLRIAIPIPLVPSFPMTVIPTGMMIDAGDLIDAATSEALPSGPPAAVSGADTDYDPAKPPSFFFVPPAPPLNVPLTFAYLRTGATLPFLAGLNQIIAGFGPLIYALVIGQFATYVQKAMLVFTANNMLAVFLPLGIMLRAFPLTRRMGSTMIAMALTLYFVYPLTLVLANSIYGLYEGSRPVGTALNADMYGTTCDLCINDIIRWMIPMMRHVIIVTLMFVLSVVICITSFRSISISIGGDASIFGLGKLGV